MLIVHHLENSRSQRILWLLEELGVDYELKRYARDARTGLAPPELEAVHPLGKAPVIEDDGATVAESAVIVEYLIDRYDDGRLRPGADSPDRRAYNYWLHYAEGSFMPLMIVSLIMARIEAAPMPFFVKPVARGIAAKVRDSYLAPNVTRHLEFMNDQLDGRDWFLGSEPSGADIQMSFALEAAEVRSSLAEDYPNLKAFLDRMRARPAYRAAVEKGGPFSLPGAG